MGEACTKGSQSERRWKEGEKQGYCATCELWVFTQDIAACPLGKRDGALEARVAEFYRKDVRGRKGKQHA